MEENRENVRLEDEQLREKYTYVEHEKDFKFNAPHHFLIKSKETDEVLVKVDFQEGPILENGVNGGGNEDFIMMVIRRLEGFQNSPFACQENADAIKCLRDGLAVLMSRTQKRVARGVEGTHVV